MLRTPYSGNMDNVEVLKRAALWFYRRHTPVVPHLPMREFGYGIKDKIERRHLCFPDLDSFQAFLIKRSPLYVSYSVGLYDRPCDTPMTKKGLRAAEFVFDLDVDVGQLFDVKRFEALKVEVLKLKEEFLLADLGLKEQDVSVNFSGHKGFHVHVTDVRFMALTAQERRRIVDYIMGVGFELKKVFKREVVFAHGKSVEVWRGPSERSKGLRLRLYTSFLQFLKPAVREQVREGVWDRVLSSKRLSRHLKDVMSTLPVRFLDAPVSYDVHRLLRVPGSFYGATGWQAVLVKDVADFNPLHHAVVLPCDRFMKVRLHNDVPALEFCNTSFGPFSKGVVTLPIALAIFLIGKGVASVEVRR